MIARDVTVGTRITDSESGIEFVVITTPIVSAVSTKFLGRADDGSRTGFEFGNDEEVIVA